jgi:hypothetical protein
MLQIEVFGTVPPCESRKCSNAQARLAAQDFPVPWKGSK